MRMMQQDRVRLRSAIPGRSRWDVDVLQHRSRKAARVELELKNRPGVREVKATPSTGRVLILYDVDISHETVGEWLRAALEQPALSPEAYRALLEASHNGHDHGDCDHDHGAVDQGAMRKYLRNMIMGGVVLAGLLIKRLVIGVGPLAASPALFAITASATVISGYPYLRGAFRSLTGRSGITTDTLVGSATVATLILRESVTGLVVIWLLNLGEYLQALTLQRTRQAIRDLLSTGDDEVWVVTPEGEIKRSIVEVQPGDEIAVYAGSYIPVDGSVLAGRGTVNQAPITGESIPVYRNPEDTVYAGTLLLAGDIKMMVSQIGADTVMGRLIQRVEEAQDMQAPIVTAGNRFSQKFVPISFAMAGLVLLLTRDVRRAVTMLLIACPCAAGLATPTAVSASIGNGARRGILIKGGTYVESAAMLDTVVVDKTGTLTSGAPEVKRVLSIHEDYKAEQVLALAANSELHSQHPLALAVTTYAQQQQGEIDTHDVCEVLVGRGVRADWEGNRVLVGNLRLLDEYEISVPSDARKMFDRLTLNGESAMYVAHQDQLIGLIGVQDLVRPEAANALAELRQLGVSRIIMLTGDYDETARVVAQEVGLAEWRAQLLPEDKYKLIQSLRDEGYHVAMVGDGINDAPALALADIGIAMGAAGSDVAIEASDIALANDNLALLPTTFRLSRQTIRLIRENYGIALGVNAGGLVAGAIGYLNPMMAALLHNLSTLLVVFNSARLINYNPDAGRPALVLPRGFTRLTEGVASVVFGVTDKRHDSAGGDT